MGFCSLFIGQLSVIVHAGTRHLVTPDVRPLNLPKLTRVLVGVVGECFQCTCTLLVVHAMLLVLVVFVVFVCACNASSLCPLWSMSAEVLGLGEGWRVEDRVMFAIHRPAHYCCPR
jgi:hypothetical protein